MIEILGITALILFAAIIVAAETGCVKASTREIPEWGQAGPAMMWVLEYVETVKREVAA